jgi:hypothetical protein
VIAGLRRGSRPGGASALSAEGIAHRDRDGHVPPHNLDAEASVLGAILITRDALTAVLATGLAVEDFYRPVHRDVFAAVLRLDTRGEPVDAVTVADELRRGGQIEDPGMLLELQAAPPAVSNVGRYAAIVREAAIRRRLIEVAAANATDAYDVATPLPTVIALSADRLERIDTGADSPIVDLVRIARELWGGADPGPWPSLMCRDGDKCLLYDGSLHLLFGPSGSGKSLLSLWTAADVLRGGGTVVWLDYEQAPKAIAAHLLRFGLSVEDVGRLVYLAMTGRPPQSVLAIVRRVRPQLLVVDALAGALGALGADESDNAAVATLLDGALRAMTADGTVVLVIDHVTAEDYRARSTYAPRPRGAQRKVDAPDVLLSVCAVRPWSRTEPGVLGVKVTKDRHGNWRHGEVALEATVTPQDDGMTLTLALSAPSGGGSAGEFRPTHLMDRLSRHVQLYPDLTSNLLMEAVPGKDSAKRLALRLLVEEGYVEVIPGPRRAHHHHHVRPFREADEGSE